MKRCWIAALAMMAVVGAADAQDSGRTIEEELVEKLDLFHLCTMDGRMDLTVGALPEHASRAGVTDERVRDVIEGRLRRARIHDPNADPLLQALFVLGEPEDGHIPFYSIELSFLRELVAESVGLSALAETWSTGGAGQGDADSLLDHLGDLVDGFIGAYGRVRQSDACREARNAHASKANPQ